MLNLQPLGHIHEVDDIELASLGYFASGEVLAVVIVEFGGQCRKLVVIDNHSKALGTMLSDKWLNDGEGLTRTRSADHPCTSEGIDDVHRPPMYLGRD